MSAYLRFAQASAWTVDHTVAPLAPAAPEGRWRYPRFERRRFAPPPDVPAATASRSSTRAFDRSSVLSTNDLRVLLEGVLPEDNGFPHASAGALYAVETFVLPKRVEQCEPDVLLHVLRPERALETLWPCPAFLPEAFPSQTWVHEAGLVVVLVAMLPPYVTQYGERGYRFAVLEAGSIAHELETRATRLGLGSCVLGGFVDVAVSSALDLSLDQGAHPVVCIAIGRDLASRSNDARLGPTAP